VQYHHHRSLLHSAMSAAGFRQHPNEWWHFSLGDQLWAWQTGNAAVAKYGNAQAV
jgi:zinc D-Ala-D-Ala dipeptidase